MSSMKAKTFLSQITKLDKMIENKMIERNQWKDIALNTTSASASVIINGVKHSMDKVQSSGNPQKMADAVVRYVDIEAEIDRHIDELIDIKKDVINVIEQLETAKYDILHKVYVQHLSLYDVADAYDKTYSWVTTIHGKALKDVQKILDERDGEDK